MSFDLEVLERLNEAATPGPWYTRAMDDGMAMCATAIATEPNTSGDNDDLAGSACHGVIAATLIQDRDYVVPADGRSQENAELIVAMRNALAALLRLARAAADQPAR